MNNKKIIYIGDPMCSWCYGIADELAQIIDSYQDQLSFEIIMGGLRPYNTQTMSELKDFLTKHWKEVHSRSGQQFRYGILDNKEIFYDTEPPSRALVVVRELRADLSFDFFKNIQKAFYFENKDMNQLESYASILENLNIDQTIFESHFNSQAAKVKTKNDFLRASQLGVRSFPTLMIHHEDKYSTIARGYSTAKKITEQIETALV